MHRPPSALRLGHRLGAGLLLGLLAACSGDVSVGTADVATSDLEQHVLDSFETEEGVELTVDCPEELAAEVDATADCSADDGQSQTVVRFTTTEVDGGEVSFETLPLLSPDVLGTTLATTLADEGYDVESVTCPEELPGTAEATTECTVLSQGEEAALTVTVSEVDGLRFRLAYQSAG